MSLQNGGETKLLEHINHNKLYAEPIYPTNFQVMQY